MTRNSNRLPFVDCWRAAAVLLVIAGHLAVNCNLKNHLSASAALHFLSSHGQTGVFIFFFISGYVVSTTCLTELKTTGKFSIVGFYIRRIFRITPPPLLIYLSTCLLCGHLLIISFTTSQLLTASLYICNNSLVECGWFAGHTWSLAFEEQFYLIFPMLFGLIHTGKWPHPIAAILTSTVASIPFIWPVHFIGRTGYIIIYTLFILGYLLARYPRAVPTSQLAVAIVFIVSTIATFLPAGDIFASLMSGTEVENRLFIGKYYKFIFIASIPLMIMSTGSPGTSLNNIFSNRYFSYFGRASYSVYLWQQLATGATPHHSTAMQLSIIFIAVVGGLLLFEFVEKRLIRLGRHLASSWS